MLPTTKRQYLKVLPCFEQESYVVRVKELVDEVQKNLIPMILL